MNIPVIFQFLKDIAVHNNREWFNAHREQYDTARREFENLLTVLIARISEFDESVRGVEARDCTYRIYRDTRFSPDKRPYKCHFGVFVCPHGKKSGYSGYYFQIGPQESGYPSGNMLASGNYQFDPKVLRILRDDISNDDEEFRQTLKKAPLFSLDDSDMLKRVPNGYPKDAPYASYLKYRTYCLIYEPGRQFMLDDNLLERTLEAFRSTKSFIDYVNRAVDYVNEAEPQP